MAANKVHWWDAPKGYKAVLDSFPLCSGCDLRISDLNCDTETKQNKYCTSPLRQDNKTVIFVKRTQKPHQAI